MTGDDEAASAGAFAHLSLIGDRFDAPGMPAETAKEVGNFRDAIWEMARELWLARNPGRRRVPEGFEAAFDLRLLRVEEGSARPQLVLNRPRGVATSETLWDEWSEIFAEARDAITGALTTAADGAAPDVPTRVRKAMRKIGNTLHDTEHISLGHPSDQKLRVSLDVTTRAILEQIDEDLSNVPTLPAEHRMTGVIVEYDGSGLSFKLRTDNGIATCVLERFNDRLAEFARSVLALDGVTAPDVSVVGDTLDANRRNMILNNVREITLVRSFEEKVLVNRKRSLSELTSGWLGPGSQPPTPDVLDNLELVMSTLVGADIPMELMPTPLGGIAVEWVRGKHEFTASIQPGGSMLLVSDDTDSDDLRESSESFDATMFAAFVSRGVMP